MKNVSSGNLANPDQRLLIDTHVIVWMSSGDPRLNRVDQAALADPDRRLCISAVVAFEFADLQQRGRFAMDETLDFLQDHIGFEIIDLPATCWQIAAGLPDIHRDPIDRLLIAHALTEGMTLVTADANIRRYPVPCI
ncbi:MAG: type II toxin-antitoxin system VapC family toxin [Sphingopyxis sp.]|uniref:type II toxin-antitoxin system VapC family toxin n=1 Tax=Sphingopyxis sp. TaxID=1908224 RepID=UPI003D80E16F